MEVGILFLIYGFLALGLNLHYGFTGIVNFGHVLFFAVGGYTTAIMVSPSDARGFALGLPWPTAFVGTLLVVIVVAAIVGFVSLPLEEEYVAIATLASAEIFHELISTFENVFGGIIGNVSIPQPIQGFSGGHYPTFMVTTVLLFFGLLAYGYVIFNRLSDGPYGRVLRAIRSDKMITEVIGKNVFRYEMEVFVFGAAAAGIAGSLYALSIGSVAPNLYSVDVTFLIWIGMLVGGPGNYRGVLGGLGIVMFFQLATRFLSDLPLYTSQQFAALRLAAIGLLLIIIIRIKPEGIWGNPKEQGIDR
jgi:branched-chain amino acid transport system permease protein